MSQEQVKAVLDVLADHEQDARKDGNGYAADRFSEAYQMIKSVYVPKVTTPLLNPDTRHPWGCDCDKCMDAADAAIDRENGN